MQSDVPLTQDVVFVGGGHAHALVLRAWGMDPLPGARLTVINPGPTAPYTGMLPGYIAGHYGRDDLEIDLVRLCQHAGARLILGHATGFDREQRLVFVEGREPVGYDVASIDVGITARMGIPGFAEHAVGAKPLDVYARAWRGFMARLQCGETVPEVAVIGGGVAGCELAMAMAHALTAAGQRPKVTVIEAGPQITGVNERARVKLLAAMQVLGVVVRAAARVTQIEADRVLIEGQEAVPFGLCVGAAGAFAHQWLAQTDLPLIEGFIEVGPDLGVVGDKRLFAVGDCAAMPFAPRPKAGVFAVRAAPVLQRNLRAALGVGMRGKFRPQKRYLKLISLGGQVAMAEKFGLAVAAPVLWRWKDRIDRTFMERLSDLQTMVAPPVPRAVADGVVEILGDKPLCGGCGAKVSGGVLAGALRTPGLMREDVVTGTGDDAAILRQSGGGYQVISTDHLRAFVADPVQMTRIAMVHALGDVFAMGAAPQVALAQVILPRMSPALQARTLAEITNTARQVLGEVGAQLVGGHTTQGAELTIGFTVTGTRDVLPITVAGAKDGDVLVLTRAIGSGVIMAGLMAGKAGGAVVSDALAHMTQTQAHEATLLKDAHAMTDVTGFGLAGHVQAICAASGVQAEIWWDQVPVYAGAQELVAAGVASSLWAANVADAPVTGRAEPLLHDPQTAGGLLAAMPRTEAEAVVAQLQAEGRTAVIIGKLSAGVGPIVVT